jgi:hypothetical protein
MNVYRGQASRVCRFKVRETLSFSLPLLVAFSTLLMFTEKDKLLLLGMSEKLPLEDGNRIQSPEHHTANKKESRIATVFVICHRHKPTDLSYRT